MLRRADLPLALMTAALAACAAEGRPSAPGYGPLAGIACAEEARGLLRDWGADEHYLEAPPGPTGSRTLRYPTGAIGQWVIVSVRGGAPVLTRLDARGEETRRFAEDCSVEVIASPRASPPGNRDALFTDADLRDAIERSARGVVVYAWSPHMPLSVDGYAEIAAAGRSLGLDVVPVLIAHGDVAFSRREAERAGIPPGGLRQVDSNELIQRDAQVHAPSILVFADGRISTVLPGYRNAEGYREYLSAFLGAGD